MNPLLLAVALVALIWLALGFLHLRDRYRDSLLQKRELRILRAHHAQLLEQYRQACSELALAEAEVRRLRREAGEIFSAFLGELSE